MATGIIKSEMHHETRKESKILKHDCYVKIASYLSIQVTSLTPSVMVDVDYNTDAIS